jgi:tRNA-dihydrouridine synthase
MDNFWRKLAKPIIGLAPMDGITDFPMRQIQVEVSRPDVLFSEFINVEGYVRNPDAFRKKLFFSDDQQPIVVQVYGSLPNDFYLAVKEIAKLGFSGIDINMGCPARKVVDRKSGGGLIGNFDLAGKIIESCLKAVTDSGEQIPLSVKTRIGKKEVITEKWIGFLSEFPIDLVTVHGRLLKNRHSGPVNWKEIKKAALILKKAGILCLGNGGVASLKEAYLLSKNHNLDGVLIGRAAWGNPWIFKKGLKPSTLSILKTIQDHADLVADFYDPEGFVTVRKHFSRYPKGFFSAKALKIDLLKAKNSQEVKKAITLFNKVKKNSG